MEPTEGEDSSRKPLLAFRVGVTGARAFDDAGQRRRVAEQVRLVLEIVRKRLTNLVSDDSSVQMSYRANPDTGRIEPDLRLLSPLAPGADSLVAEVAMEPELNYRVHAILPFPEKEYEKTFDREADVLTFRALLKQVGKHRLELDGDRNFDNDAYMAVGRFVVRHCDLLIAIWDGEPAKGRGGTGDIVHYAAAAGIPVCHIMLDGDQEPMWISSTLDLRYPSEKPAAVHETLGVYIDTIAKAPRGVGRQKLTPQAAYYREKRPLSAPIWRAYTAFERWILPKAPRRRDETHNPRGALDRYWYDRYQPANALAEEYAARYRSSYLWIILFGVLTVLLAASALTLGVSVATISRWLGHPWHAAVGKLHLAALICVGIEIASFTLIVLLIYLNRRYAWHSRSVEYRLLAELYRKERVLGVLGTALPVSAIRRMEIHDEVPHDRTMWVSWMFSAEQRAAPFPSGSWKPGHQDNKELLKELIAGQLDFHEKRAASAKAAGHRLVKWGETAFGIAFASVLMKVALSDFFHRDDFAVGFAWAATILPAASAALVAIRAYSEFEHLASQSRYMIVELTRSRTRVERIDMKRPSASQDLAAEAVGVVTLMLQDLSGWARLFRVKGVEA